MLAERLRELRDAEIIAASDNTGYRLTGEGQAVLEALAPIDAWARRGAKRTARRRP